MHPKPPRYPAHVDTEMGLVKTHIRYTRREKKNVAIITG